MTWLIDPAQLEKFRKSQRHLVILDASYHGSGDHRDAYQEFLQGHIPDAQYLDLTRFHDQSSPLPNMLLRDETVIAERMSELGITNQHKIIVYDQSEHFTSCRALWMFRIFGHSTNQLYLLNGGLSAWKMSGGNLEQGESRKGNKSYVVDYQSQLLRSLVQMKANLHHPREQVIDMRHAARFAGGAEIRADSRRGHIPGSISFPFMTMFENNGYWKPLEKIRQQLYSIGVDFDVPIVTTCGSGITACILNVALDLMGEEHHSLYDGSWSEWGYNNIYSGEESLNERPVRSSVDK